MQDIVYLNFYGKKLHAMKELTIGTDKIFYNHLNNGNGVKLLCNNQNNEQTGNNSPKCSLQERRKWSGALALQGKCGCSLRGPSPIASTYLVFHNCLELHFEGVPSHTYLLALLGSWMHKTYRHINKINKNLSKRQDLKNQSNKNVEIFIYLVYLFYGAGD